MIDEIFTSIRKLNVRNYWFTLVDTENEKGLWVCDRFRFGFINKTKLQNTEPRLTRFLTAVSIRKPGEENDYVTVPLLLFKDLTSESLKEYINSHLTEV